jgi:hypothetical protein
MPKKKQIVWCCNREHPCRVKVFLRQRTSYFSLEEVAEEIGESPRKILYCLENLKDWNIVCRHEKRNLWSPDHPL